VRVYNIRSGRKQPGLKPQHLLSAHAANAVSSGRLEGAVLNSRELIFYPGPLKAGSFCFDVSNHAHSAGSTCLVLQTILPALCFAGGKSSVVIKGGTHVEWSPPADYLRDVFLPTVLPMGISFNLSTVKWGFYPAGGGEVDVRIDPAPLPLFPINITERGALKKISVLSAAGGLPLDIARRQFERAKERLRENGFTSGGRYETAASLGRGTFLFVLATFENIRAGFSSLGARGKKAASVSDEAVDAFLRYMGNKGALDAHLSDQVLLFMALAKGGSSITTAELTQHLRTNAYVIERFLPVRFLISEENPPAVKVMEGSAFVYEWP